MRRSSCENGGFESNKRFLFRPNIITEGILVYLNVGMNYLIVIHTSGNFSNRFETSFTINIGSGVH